MCTNPYIFIINVFEGDFFFSALINNIIRDSDIINYRSSHPEVFLEKGILKICSKFTGEHPCRSVISIKLLCNFIEITLRHGCSPANLMHIFRTPFSKNTSGWLLPKLEILNLLNCLLPKLWTGWVTRLPACPSAKWIRVATKIP